MDMEKFSELHILIIEGAIGSMFASLLLQSLDASLQTKWLVWAVLVFVYFKYLRSVPVSLLNEDTKKPPLLGAFSR